jgi:hypothetical protein
MQAPSKWQVVVIRGLKAHFKQDDGSSKAGTDWAVAIRDDLREHKILVRAYADDVLQADQTQEAAMVGDFVGRLLDQGWTPDEWTGRPGELTLPGNIAKGETPAPNPKPWWRFW